VTGIGGIVDPGFTAGALRMKAARFCAVLGTAPAIRPISSNPASDGPSRPWGQSRPGISWHDPQPARSIAASPLATLEASGW
jgi:hypothetical protein